MKKVFYPRFLTIGERALRRGTLLMFFGMAMVCGSVYAERLADETPIPWDQIVNFENPQYSGLTNLFESDFLADFDLWAQLRPKLIPGLSMEQFKLYVLSFRKDALGEEFGLWVQQKEFFRDAQRSIEDQLVPHVHHDRMKGLEIKEASERVNRFAERWITILDEPQISKPDRYLIEARVRDVLQRKYPDFESDFSRYRREFERAVESEFQYARDILQQGNPRFEVVQFCAELKALELFVNLKAFQFIFEPNRYVLYTFKELSPSTSRRSESSYSRRQIYLKLERAIKTLGIQDIHDIEFVKAIDYANVDQRGNEADIFQVGTTKNFGASAEGNQFLIYDKLTKRVLVDQEGIGDILYDRSINERDIIENQIMGQTDLVPTINEYNLISFLRSVLYSLGRRAQQNDVEQVKSYLRRLTASRMDRAMANDHVNYMLDTFWQENLAGRIFFSSFKNRLEQNDVIARQQRRPDWTEPLQQLALRFFTKNPRAQRYLITGLGTIESQTLTPVTQGDSKNQLAKNTGKDEVDLQSRRIVFHISAGHEMSSLHWNYLIQSPDIAIGASHDLRLLQPASYSLANSPSGSFLLESDQLLVRPNDNLKLLPLYFVPGYRIVNAQAIDTLTGDQVPLYVDAITDGVYLKPARVYQPTRLKLAMMFEPHSVAETEKTQARQFELLSRIRVVPWRIVRLIPLLKEANLTELARSFEAMLQSSLPLDIDRITDAVRQTGIYSFDVTRFETESNSRNPFLAFRGFANDQGIACYQCDGAARLLIVIFEKILKLPFGFTIQPVSNFLRGWGSETLTQANAHLVAGIFFAKTLVKVYDATPSRFQGQVLKEEVHVDIKSSEKQNHLDSLRREILSNKPLVDDFKAIKSDRSHPLLKALFLSKLILESDQSEVKIQMALISYVELGVSKSITSRQAREQMRLVLTNLRRQIKDIEMSQKQARFPQALKKLYDPKFLSPAKELVIESLQALHRSDLACADYLR